MTEEKKRNWILRHASEVSIAVLVGAVLSGAIAVFSNFVDSDDVAEWLKDLLNLNDARTTEVSILGFEIGSTQLESYLENEGIPKDRVSSVHLSREIFGDQNQFDRIIGKVADSEFPSSISYAAYFQRGILRSLHLWYQCEEHDCMKLCYAHQASFRSVFKGSFSSGLREAGLEGDDKINPDDPELVYESQRGKRENWIRYDDGDSSYNLDGFRITNIISWRAKYQKFYSRNYDSHRSRWGQWTLDSDGSEGGYNYKYCHHSLQISKI